MQPNQIPEKGDRPLLTSKGLPVISSDTLQALLQNFTQRENWGAHIQEVKNRLIVEIQI